MKYKITVIAYDKNNDYEVEMAQWKEKRSDYPRMTRYPDECEKSEPSMEKATRALEVYLNEEEYQQIKKGVLTTFK